MFNDISFAIAKVAEEYLVAYNIFNDKTEEEASRTFIKETIEEGNWVDVREM